MPDLPPDVAARLAQSRDEAIRDKREGILLVRRPLRPGEEPGSYIGGLPRLREDLDWPVSERTGLPFSFVAQIDLRDVPRPQGVFFPAEGLLWFFADFSEDQFFNDQHTCVLFDPHPGSVAPEREAPPNLPPISLNSHYQYGWDKAQHPRIFVEPKAGLFMHLVDTFYDLPYDRPGRLDGFDELKFFGPGGYMKMIDELREDAIRRATGVRRTEQAYWHGPRSGYGEPHWPATSIDAEYALMSLASDHRFYLGMKDHPCPPEFVTELAERLQAQIRILRRLGPRPLAPAERAAVIALTREVRHGFARFDQRRHPTIEKGIRGYLRRSHMGVHSVLKYGYPHAAFEILSTMPDAEKYVPAELLDPYQELRLGGQLYFHQMFGHGSSPQDAPHRAEEGDYVLLLQLGGSPTLGLPLMGDAAMHYWIPKKDLARGRFDRVEGTWEAG